MTMTAFLKHTKKIIDPRQQWKVIYKLNDILFLTVSAVLGGSETWEEIADFGQLRAKWLSKYCDFSEGIPSHQTIARVMGMISPKQFQECFVAWMQECQENMKGKLVAIDGKTLRRSYRGSDKTAVVHMVSAFCVANQQVLGQVKTDAKSNEITAIPVLLDLLDVQESLVSIDAMGCQTKIANKILSKGANYLLAVKGNQSSLKSAFEYELSYAKIREKVESGHDYYKTTEQHHGREEAREYFVFEPFGELLEKSYEWPQMKTVGVALSMRKEKADQASEYSFRYYISSAELNAEEFGKAVRGHWQIESGLHWWLDVAMREDDCKISRDNAAENLSTIRRIALNLLKQDKSRKGGVRRKQKAAGLSEDYMARVLAG